MEMNHPWLFFPPGNLSSADHCSRSSPLEMVANWNAESSTATSKLLQKEKKRRKCCLAFLV